MRPNLSLDADETLMNSKPREMASTPPGPPDSIVFTGHQSLRVQNLETQPKDPRSRVLVPLRGLLNYNCTTIMCTTNARQSHHNTTKHEGARRTQMHYSCPRNMRAHDNKHSLLVYLLAEFTLVGASFISTIVALLRSNSYTCMHTHIRRSLLPLMYKLRRLV